METTYSTHIEQVEAPLGLRPQAASAARSTLINGPSAAEAYGKTFRSPDGEAKLTGRTPFTLDRDRILYSDSFRRQDDKFHVLFFGKTRRARNYTTHAVKVAHLARAAAARLHLNSELAEAISLGAKVGAVPFLHVGKETVPRWLNRRMRMLAQTAPPLEPPAKPARKRARYQPHAELELGDAPTTAPAFPTPNWLPLIDGLEPDPAPAHAFPWARGWADAPVYSSGAFSYWSLATNPFRLLPRSPNSDTTFTAQTLYGVWRHSLDPDEPTDFSHTVHLRDGTAFNLNSSHATYEAAIARYCDDIAWALENLGEASRVDLADALPETAYLRFNQAAELQGLELDGAVLRAILGKDSGRLYSYFLDDLVKTTERALDGDAPVDPDESEVRGVVGLSEQAAATLAAIIDFLNEDVFKKPSVDSRNRAVSQITETALDILESLDNGTLLGRAEKLGRVEGWWDAGPAGELQQQLASDKHFRLQACVAALIAMSDRELFDLVGLE